MKGLSTLIRLHKLKLTEHQRKQTALQAVAQGFVAQIQALEQSARGEAAAVDANPEMAHTLGSFVQALITRRQILEGSLAEINQELEAIRAEVATAFRELKRYELIEERRLDEEKRAIKKRERRTEDEISMTIHRQKMKAAHG